jgi:hypothetical protein
MLITRGFRGIVVKGSPHRRRVYKSVTSITTSIATSITSYRKKNPLENESLGVIGDLEQLRKRYSVDHFVSG